MRITLSEKISAHEAGHAVCAEWLGFTVLSASTDPPEVVYLPTADRWAELLVVMAGPAAEADWTGRRMAVDGHDWRRAWPLARRVAGAGGDPERVFKAAARTVRDLVAEPPVSHAIRRVADELLKRLDVDGALVRAALAESRARWG